MFTALDLQPLTLNLRPTFVCHTNSLIPMHLLIMILVYRNSPKELFLSFGPLLLRPFEEFDAGIALNLKGIRRHVLLESVYYHI